LKTISQISLGIKSNIMETKIAFLRKRLNMTQEELAELAGVTRQTIISLEQGRYNPSLDLAVRIRKALKQKSVEDVFKA
jgi:putative transcriptional regulator